MQLKNRGNYGRQTIERIDLVPKKNTRFPMARLSFSSFSWQQLGEFPSLVVRGPMFHNYYT